MNIYFYHTQDLGHIYKEWKAGKFPGHFLYGATHLERYGITSILHRHKVIKNRLALMAYVAWQVLTCYKKFKAVYGTSFRGLELIILLRALGLFRKPILIWHHQAITKAKNPLREKIAQLYYRGIDHLFFFSEKLIKDSLKSKKARPERMQMAHWGADLDFYNRLMEQNAKNGGKGFISTGKENRDMPTLIQAFDTTKESLDIYISHRHGEMDYDRILGKKPVAQNIRIHFMNGLIPYELSQKVWQSNCIVICCLETDYTVGLTTLVEAFALGIPVICSRNPNFGMDIDKEGVGITVPYYDNKGWENAIRYITSHPIEVQHMGQRARTLAEKKFNLDICAGEVAQAILMFSQKK